MAYVSKSVLFAFDHSCQRPTHPDRVKKPAPPLEELISRCHVAHSQKKKSDVPKDQIVPLVDLQINSTKPIRCSPIPQSLMCQVLSPFEMLAFSNMIRSTASDVAHAFGSTPT